RARRRDRLGDVRRGLPGRALGPRGQHRAAAAGPGRRGDDDRRGDRHDHEHDRRRCGADRLRDAEAAMTRYLKAPNPPTLEATDELRARVSSMLRDIELGGIDAVRRWSEELDGWAPDSFVVTDEDHARAEAQLDDELKGHIAFALEQVRGFA